MVQEQHNCRRDASSGLRAYSYRAAERVTPKKTKMILNPAFDGFQKHKQTSHLACRLRLTYEEYCDTTGQSPIAPWEDAKWAAEVKLV